jgi:hypothetical protein
MVVNDDKEEKPPPPYGTTPGAYANDDADVGPVGAGLGPAAPAPGLSEPGLRLSLELGEGVGVGVNRPDMPGGEVGVEVALALALFDDSGLSPVFVFVFVSIAAVGVLLTGTFGIEPEPPGELGWLLLPGCVLEGWLPVEPLLLLLLLGAVA